MKRLWVQQTLAFSAVVLITTAAIGLWINRSAGVDFRKYMTRSALENPDSGWGLLVEHYEQYGSWKGVEALLAEGVYFCPRPGIRLGASMDAAENARCKEEQPAILLADADRRILYDSTGKNLGEPLNREEQANALPLTVSDGEDPTGYLSIYYSVTEPLGKLEQEFLGRVERTLLVGSALAVASILAVGALLSRRLNAPLQRLAGAARAVASGQLDQRVETSGSAEVAQVGRAFNEMTEALGKAESLRRNLVADVAHELRTPLTVLQGGLWAILNDTYPLEKAEISRLYDETRLLGRLVEDLRELAMADTGELHLDLAPNEIAPVVHQTVDSLSLVAEAQRISLTTSIPDGLAPALADPDRVAQILRNLLVNALRHTPPGGSVTVSAIQTPTEVEIAVADTGEGIAPEHLSHVFERFWRADRARTRASEESPTQLAGGTGLGLSVAQSLVRAQSSRIWVESTPGEGATFRFTLPLAEGGQ